MPEVDKYLTGAIEHLAYPGVAVGVIAEGELVWFKGYGVANLATRAPVTEDTVFRIGSITKTFTGLSLLELRDEGRISLDDPINRYLPEASGIVFPTKDSPPIEIRNLFTHTSGLVRHGPLGNVIRSDRDATPNEVAGVLNGLSLEYPPGTDDRYSNLGAALAGVIVTRVSGMPYERFLRTKILGPLGMTSSGFDPDSFPGRVAQGYVKNGYEWVPGGHERFGAANGMGGLYSTVRDMARYAAFQMSAWPARDEPDHGPVRRSSVRESQLGGGFQPSGTQQVGVYWIVFSDCRDGHLIFHNGAVSDGYKSALYIRPRARLGIVALANIFTSENLNAIDGVMKQALDKITSLEASTMPGMQRIPVLLLAAFGKTDQTTLSAAFSQHFLDSIPDTPSFIANLAKEGGGCYSANVLAPGDKPNSAIVEVVCQKQTYQATVVLDGAGKIGGMWVKSAPTCH